MHKSSHGFELLSKLGFLLPCIWFLNFAGSSYDPSYATVDQNAASLEWQQQMKQTYNQSYNSGYVHGQSSAIDSDTGYAAAASVYQYSSAPSGNQYTSAPSADQYSSSPSVYQYNSALSVGQSSSVNQYSSAANTTVPSVDSYSGMLSKYFAFIFKQRLKVILKIWS